MIIIQSGITSDLPHEADGSFNVLFILKLSDPDIKFVRLAPIMVIVELETLDMTLPSWVHPLGLQPG